MKIKRIPCGKNVVINGNCYLAQQELYEHPEAPPVYASAWGSTATEAVEKMRLIRQNYSYVTALPAILYHYDEVTA
jgi:hypothetical protein